MKKHTTVLKTLAVGLGVLTAGGAVAMAVPEVRNKTLDWIAPHSQIYKTQAEDLANTQTELEQTKQTLADKQTQVETLTLDKQNLTNQVNDLHSQIIQKDNQLNELNSTLQAKEQELETQTEYLETCQTKALEIKTKIETLTQEDSQLNAQAIATLQDDLLKIETDVTNVENRISTLKGSISNLNANISTLTQEKQDLQATVDSLNAQVESLNNQINGLNEQITSLQEQVQALSNSGVNSDYIYYNCLFFNCFFEGDELYDSITKDNAITGVRNAINGLFIDKYASLEVTYSNRTTSCSCLINGFLVQLTYKINGLVKTGDEVIDYINSTNQEKYQVKYSFSETSNILSIDFIEFPLSGKYIFNDTFFDFDNGHSNTMVNNYMYLRSTNEELLLCGRWNSYIIKIVSDTELLIDGNSYSKLNEDESIDLEVGTYSGDNTSNFIFSADGSLSVENVGSGGCWFVAGDKLYMYFESFSIAQITSTTSFELNGKTYTKQVSYIK